MLSSGRSGDEPPLRTLADIIGEFVRQMPPETLEIYLAKIRMGRDHPNLRPFMAAQWGVFERELREQVAQHTRIDSAEDMYPSLVAAGGGFGHAVRAPPLGGVRGDVVG